MRVSRSHAEPIFIRSGSGFNTDIGVLTDELGRQAVRLVVEDDVVHSDTEARFYALGRTDADRLLFVVYTLRGEPLRLRVISARDMEPHERREYEDARTREFETDPEV